MILDSAGGANVFLVKISPLKYLSIFNGDSHVDTFINIWSAMIPLIYTYLTCRSVFHPLLYTVWQKVD